jgi:hypothetical protein
MSNSLTKLAKDLEGMKMNEDTKDSLPKQLRHAISKPLTNDVSKVATNSINGLTNMLSKVKIGVKKKTQKTRERIGIKAKTMKNVKTKNKTRKNKNTYIKKLVHKYTGKELAKNTNLNERTKNLIKLYVPEEKLKKIKDTLSKKYEKL